MMIDDLSNNYPCKYYLTQIYHHIYIYITTIPDSQQSLLNLHKNSRDVEFR